jgi:hypothetical protein
VGFPIQPRIAWQVLDGEAVLIDLEGGRSLGLNAAGSFLWPRLPTSSAAELVEALVAEFEVDAAVARRDVEAFLALLRTRGFIGA